MNKFAQWMENNDKVQKYVAVKLGISPSSLHEIIRLDKLPSIRIAYEIEKYTMGAVTIYDWLDQDLNNKSTPMPKKRKAASTKK
jgi:transcriptional regulator with XRE-family HTH domain